MASITIVVADAARARIFTHNRGPEPVVDHQPALNEVVDLINPERRMRPAERHSERASTGVTPTGLAFGLDDHRDEHEAEIDRRFAAVVVAQAMTALDASKSRVLVVVAGPHFLGLLRPRLATLPARGVELHEVAHDLTHETTPSLHDHLAHAGVVRPRERPEG